MSWRVIIFVVLIIVTGVLIVERVWSASFEAPKYEVLFKQGNFELRNYEPFVVITYTSSSDFAKSGNLAFPKLAGYISGNNTKKQKIPMTVPVLQSNQVEKQNQLPYSISFVLPSNILSKGDAPVPNDSNIIIEEKPKRILASLRYYGDWSYERYVAEHKLLLEKIEAQNWKPQGLAEFARYNAPITPWFLRKNEILIEIDRKSLLGSVDIDKSN